MPRTCTVCAHAKREEINKALVAGEPLRNVAIRFGTSVTAAFRHKREHLPVALAKAVEAQEVVEGSDLLAQVRGLQTKAMCILAKAEAAGDLRAALAAIREARGTVELLAKLTAELEERAARNSPIPVREVWDLSPLTDEELRELSRLQHKALRRENVYG